MDRNEATNVGRPESGAVSVGDWTGTLPTENASTRTHRRQQGAWRSDVARWPAGPPQRDHRVRDRYPTLPSWLAESHDGVSVEDAGINLMSDEARAYARDRLAVLARVDGHAEPERFWRNLLSSQPLAFSVAGHLRHHREAATELVAALTGLPVASLAALEAGRGSWADYALDGIEAEWFPPRDHHTNDMSGCDIACCATLQDGRRVLVTIEVKYTDTFSPKPVTWARYSSHLEELGLDENTMAGLVGAGCSQVLRQAMLTDSVRRRGLAAGAGPDGRVDDALVVVLAREDDGPARDVVATLDRAIGDVLRAGFWSHRDLIGEAAKIASLRTWADGMAERYLLA